MFHLSMFSMSSMVSMSSMASMFFYSFSMSLDFVYVSIFYLSNFFFNIKFH